LREDINLPFLFLAADAASYPVDFSAARVQANQLQLVDDATGKGVDCSLRMSNRIPRGQ